MGHGVDFFGSNRKYGPPPGVSEDQCATLHVFSNGACIVSAWEFTDEEILEIVRTRRAFLSVWSGATLFPVFVGSENVTRGLVADSGAVWKQQRRRPSIMGHQCQRDLGADDAAELEALSAAITLGRPIDEVRIRKICSWFDLPAETVETVIAMVNR